MEQDPLVAINMSLIGMNLLPGSGSLSNSLDLPGTVFVSSNQLWIDGRWNVLEK